MKCPRCDESLDETNFKEAGFVVVDVCPSCSGVWFDEGELDQLDDGISSNAEFLAYQPVSDEHEQLVCPRCQKPLEAISPVESPDLVIDRCATCRGFWLDEGELDHVRSVLLDVNSEANESEPLERPLSWSWTKWVMYRFWKVYREDIETIGKSGRMRHKE